MTEPQDHGTERPVSRRALVKAGWALPLVIASTSLPKQVFAQSSGAPTGGGDDNGPTCPPSGEIPVTTPDGEVVYVPCNPGDPV